MATTTTGSSDKIFESCFRDIVRDMQNGMSISQVVKKYRLNRESFQQYIDRYSAFFKVFADHKTRRQSMRISDEEMAEIMGRITVIEREELRQWVKETIEDLPNLLGAIDDPKYKFKIAKKIEPFICDDLFNHQASKLVDRIIYDNRLVH